MTDRLKQIQHYAKWRHPGPSAGGAGGYWGSIEKITRKRNWWEADPGETFRVTVKGGGVYDLVKAWEEWVLERVWD